jgi:hypothetical protein
VLRAERQCTPNFTAASLFSSDPECRSIPLNTSVSIQTPLLVLIHPSNPFPSCITSGPTYPEVQIQVATSSKLAVADLEGDGHPVVGVQHLVEALARVRSELDVVRIAENHTGQEYQQRTEEARHVCGVAASRGWCWSWSWSVWM